MISRITALALLVLLLPLLLCLGVLVALTMGRPVIFRQTRAGAGGKPFT
ncbi:sugar transferase, partial [Qipengyuania pacifica]